MQNTTRSSNNNDHAARCRRRRSRRCEIENPISSFVLPPPSPRDGWARCPHETWDRRRYVREARACVVPLLSVCTYGRRTREGFARVIASDVARSDFFDRAWHDHAEHAFAPVHSIVAGCPYCNGRIRQDSAHERI